MFKTGVSNSTGFEEFTIHGFSKYGTFRNNWRRRTVTVYQHPTDRSKVISVGVGENETTICTEPYSLYKSRIEDNDWSDYN